MPSQPSHPSHPSLPPVPPHLLAHAEHLALLRPQKKAQRNEESLSPDCPTAAAQVLSRLQSPDTDTDLASALERLREENCALLDSDADTILTSLASQLQILEAIFQRYTLEAMKPGLPDHRAAFQKIAFTAQAAYVRAAALLVTARDAKGVVAVSRNCDDGNVDGS